MSPTTDDALAARFAPFRARMEAAGVPEVAIQTFRSHYAALVAGETGEMAESQISPVATLPAADHLAAALEAVGQRALSSTVVLKLNGGLGTSMGLSQAKSLLQVKGERTFLDLIAQQAGSAGCPLVFMNSFATRDDTLNALKQWPAVLDSPLPVDFLQHQVPKVDAATLAPAVAEDPALEWCPPGHGDLYTALVTRGLLSKLREQGYRRLFVSNSDNLGATLDLRILGWMVQESVPFLMEVARRTEADRKGGHLALSGDQLVLREVAQCPSGDLDQFQDIRRHKYFNTNNLWVDLDALHARIEATGPLVLPLIRNQKTVNPRDASSARVFQLETAMGAAIAVFPGAQAIVVSRDRLVPVKTTADLLRVRSDQTRLEPDGRLVPATPRATRIQLDPQHYKRVSDLEAHFPGGPPSLVHCDALTVQGDVRFGENVVIKGTVRIVHEGPEQASIPADTVLEDTTHQP